MTQNALPQLSDMQVKLDNILSLPARITIPNKILKEKFCEIAKKDPKKLPLVKIGSLQNKLYSINNHNVIEGCRLANLSHIPNVEIKDYQNIQEIILEHVRESFNDEIIDPLSIFDVIDYFEEKTNMSKQEILEQLLISKTPYEKIPTLTISAKAIESLRNIILELSERKNILPARLQIPIFILTKISRLSAEHLQLLAVEKLKQLIVSIPESRFVWPSAEQLDTLFSFLKSRENKTRNNSESVLSTKSTLKEILESRPEVSTPVNDAKSTKSAIKCAKIQPQDFHKETKSILKSIPNMIIIPNEKDGSPKLLVDKSTGRVAKIENEHNHKLDSIIKISGTPSKKLYSMPFSVAEHLGMTSNETKIHSSNSSIRHKNFDNITELSKFIKKFQNIQSKSTLFWIGVTT